MKKLLFISFLCFLKLSGYAQQDNPYKVFGYKPKVEYKDNPIDIYRVTNKDGNSRIKYLTFDRENKTILLFDDRDSVLRTITYTDEDLLRWVAVDPKAQKYPSLSPYNYVNDNPIRSIDPNGMEIVDANNKPITYTVNKDGSLAWSSNATAGAMTIGNALAKKRSDSRLKCL